MSSKTLFSLLVCVGLAAAAAVTLMRAPERGMVRLDLTHVNTARVDHIQINGPEGVEILKDGDVWRLTNGREADGEAVLAASVKEALSGSEAVADLFSGLGTFALATKSAYAAEASRDAVSSLQRAAPGMTVEHRDLYRRPLDREELGRFDGVVLDPPRAGAEQQVRQLAGSTVAKIAFVSCNPATFARDARFLCDGGCRLDWVRPVGQFRWSTHVELAASFSR